MKDEEIPKLNSFPGDPNLQSPAGGAFPNPQPLLSSASDCLACLVSSESEEKHRSCFFVLSLVDEQLFERKENSKKTGKF